MRSGFQRCLVPLATLVVAAGSGALSLLAFAPFDVPPLALVSPAVLILLWQRASPGLACLQGWAGAMGLLLPGVFWLRMTGYRMNTVTELEAAALTVVFVAVMALAYAAAGGIFALLRPRGRIRAALVAAALWVLADWLRGRPYIAFPTWLGLGYSQVDTPIAGWAPLLGLHGVTFLLVLTAGLLPGLIRPPRAMPAVILLGIWLGGAALRPLAWSEPAGPPLRASLIQAPLYGQEQWSAELRDRNAATLFDLTRNALQTSDLVVTSESALGGSDFGEFEERFLRPFETEIAGRGKLVVLNSFEYVAAERYRYNRVLVLGDGGRSHYDKRILVPVGEFMPRGRLLDPVWQWLGIYYGGNVRHGAGLPPRLKIGRFEAAIAVCYESAFGDQLRTAFPEAAFIVNMSNDSWFDGSLEPEQQLQMARMRALETRRWVLRATLTGHTAFVDPQGRIAARAPQGGIQVLAGEIVPMAGATPYIRWGDAPVLGLAMALVGWAAWGRRRSSRQREADATIYDASTSS